MSSIRETKIETWIFSLFIHSLCFYTCLVVTPEGARRWRMRRFGLRDAPGSHPAPREGGAGAVGSTTLCVAMHDTRLLDDALLFCQSCEGIYSSRSAASRPNNPNTWINYFWGCLVLSFIRTHICLKWEQLAMQWGMDSDLTLNYVEPLAWCVVVLSESRIVKWSQWCESWRNNNNNNQVF
jgi:hypothetical protein